jgi:hypothetical protein
MVVPATLTTHARPWLPRRAVDVPVIAARCPSISNATSSRAPSRFSNLSDAACAEGLPSSLSYPSAGQKRGDEEKSPLDAVRVHHISTSSLSDATSSRAPSRFSNLSDAACAEGLPSSLSYPSAGQKRGDEEKSPFDAMRSRRETCSEAPTNTKQQTQNKNNNNNSLKKSSLCALSPSIFNNNNQNKKHNPHKKFSLCALSPKSVFHNQDKKNVGVVGEVIQP